MQVKLDNEIVFEIDDIKFKLIADYVQDPISDIKRRLKWVIEHLCDEQYKRLEASWLEKLREDPSIVSLPKGKEDLARVIFSHKDYKNRAEREKISE